MIKLNIGNAVCDTWVVSLTFVLALESHFFFKKKLFLVSFGMDCVSWEIHRWEALCIYLMGQKCRPVTVTEELDT